MVTAFVERATSDMLIGPDWALNLEICDFVNNDPGQVKDVVKGLKRRIGSKNPKVQLLTLTLLETLVKNCGDVVHMHVAEREILHEMVKIVKKKPDIHVKHKILTLIDAWQEAFGGPKPRYPQYYAAYQELLRAGVIFPQRSETPVPIFTPPQTQPLISYRQNRQKPEHQQNPPESSDEANYPSLSLTEIQNARSIMDVLAEMLNAIDPGNKKELKQEVIVDLVEQCRVYKQRVVHLVNKTSDESLLCQGLALNDDLQRLLAKHEAISSRTYVPVEKPKTQGVVDVCDPIANRSENGMQQDGRSSSSASASNQPLELLVPSSCSSNGPVITSTTVAPKIDLLSGDDYDFPHTENSLALVPVCDAQPSSPISQNNAIVLSDMFYPSNSSTHPFDTQSIYQTGQTYSPTSQFQHQQPPQHPFDAQSIYPTGQTYSPTSQFQHQQPPQHPFDTQSVYPTGQTYSPTSQFQHQLSPHQSTPFMQYANGNSGNNEQQLSPFGHVNHVNHAWNGELAQGFNHQQQSMYGTGSPSSNSTLPPPPWEIQENNQAGTHSQPMQVTQVVLTHTQPVYNGMHPPHMVNNNQLVGMYIQPVMSGQLAAMHHQHQGENNQMMGMHPKQLQGTQTTGILPQPASPVSMQSNQMGGYGYEYGRQPESQFLEQRMHGLSMQDESSLRSAASLPSSYATSHMPVNKQSKPEDKLFGDLVDMAKLKPKISTTRRAGSM